MAQHDRIFFAPYTTKRLLQSAELSSNPLEMKKRKSLKRTIARPTTLLGKLAEMPEKLFSGAFLQQYAALCFRINAEERLELLVITSRSSGRWIIPKGWPMKARKPYAAAALEAWQEAGVRGIVRKKPVGRYTYLKWLDDGDIAPCIVDVFQMEVNSSAEKFKERHQRILAWVSPEEAARRVREVELKSILVNFKPLGLKRPRATKKSAGI
jgi:8-oxo-dGTP pyrophosphatase MutT (NUDIX family)